MPFIVDGDIIELRAYYQMSGQTLMNVFHYKADETSADLDMVFALQFALNEWAENPALWPQVWASNATEDCTIVKLAAQKIFPSRYFHVSKIVDIPGTTDTTGSPSLPQNVQLSVTKVSDAVGRGRTGRVEVPGLHSDLVTPGTITPAAILWLEALGESMKLSIDMEELSPSKLKPVILHRFAPAGSPELLTYRVQETVRVVRRRTVGVGQ